MKTTIQKAFKFRLYPTEEQKRQLASHFGQARFVFNYFLRQRIDYYLSHKDEEKKGLNYYDTARMLTELKKSEDFEWLNESNSQVLQQSLRNLDKAYTNFFAGGAFPNFKKKRSRQSITIPQNFTIDEQSGTITVPKMKPIKTVFHRAMQGVLRNLTISCEPSGKYFVSVLCAVTLDIPIKTTGGEIGIDLGLKTFVVASDGQTIDKPAHLRESERKLKKLQRSLSRKQKGGANRAKARIKVAKLHEKIRNQRTDFLHKASRKLIDENQVIYAESLNVKGMVKNHCLAKSVSDAGWGEFVRQLQYKAQWYGVRFEQIDRFFPSSKRCNACGWINESLALKDREWTCHGCGSVIERDLNAAQNILQFGQAMVGRDAPEPKRLKRLRVVKRVVESGSRLL
jgi:putative transposase